MKYRLVYDALTTSEAPKAAMGYAIVAMLIVLVWGAWLRYRGHPLHAGVKFVGLIAVIMLAVSVGYRFEQRSIAKKTPERTEGVLAGHWENRQRRAGSGSPSYWEWEGFSVGEVAFAYIRNSEDIYFHNAGANQLQLKDGMPVRVHYLAERDGEKVRTHIVKFEVVEP